MRQSFRPSVHARLCVLTLLPAFLLNVTAGADELPVGFSLVPVHTTGDYVIDGHSISFLTGGRDVTFEIYLRGWYPNPTDDPYLSGCQATIDRAVFTSGLNGHLEFAYTSCESDAQCPPDGYWILGQCVDGLCNLPSALYVDQSHDSYIFKGVISVWALFEYETPPYVGIGNLVEYLKDAAYDDGKAKYVGTVVLSVSPDAAGTFTIDLVDDPDYTLINGTLVVPIQVPGLTPGVIIVHGDCNENGLPDDWEIAEGGGIDCNGNGLPDQCDPDCNNNGIADSCDLANETSLDCNSNFIPDECDVSAGSSDDCDVNGIPDACEYGWSEQAKIIALDGTGLDSFGGAVAIDGDVAVVGAVDGDTGHGRTGSAYVFRWDGASWVQEAKLIASDGEEGDRFGRAVSVSGDTIVVGAPYYDGVAFNGGSAYVFRYVGEGVWIEEAKLTPSLLIGVRLGSSVALSGDVLVAGAPHASIDGVRTGLLYIFHRSDGGTPGDPTDDSWNESQVIVPLDATAGDWFGASAAVSGSRLVGGASHLADGESGAAYVFRLDDNGTPSDDADDLWVEEGKLTPSAPQAGDYFGNSVSIFGDRVAVGAPLDNQAGERGGAVYVFRYSDAGTPADPSDDAWESEAKLIGSDTGPGDWFGYSVAISNDSVFVGGPGAQAAGLAYAGAVYVFRLHNGGTPLDASDDRWAEHRKLHASDKAKDDQLGNSVAVDGEVLITGAPRVDDQGNSAGAAYIFTHADELLDDDQDLIGDVCDNCDLYNPDQTDCQPNGVGDACDIDDGTSKDCNANTVLDECDIAAGTSEDCQPNGIPDVCDIANVTSQDLNGNGIPDECDVPTGACCLRDGLCVDSMAESDCVDVGTYQGGGTACATLPDSDGDGVVDCIDQCPGTDDGIYAPGCNGAIPTISHWGLIVLTLLLLSVGKIYLGRRRGDPSRSTYPPAP